MTDQPLFQDADEREARYAPQERPDDVRSEAESGDRGATVDSDFPAIAAVPATNTPGDSNIVPGVAIAPPGDTDDRTDDE